MRRQVLSIDRATFKAWVRGEEKDPSTIVQCEKAEHELDEGRSIHLTVEGRVYSRMFPNGDYCDEVRF